MNILIIIPARSGSQRIPNKNILPLSGEPCGTSLLGLACIAAYASRGKLIEHTVHIAVSTDNITYMANLPKGYGDPVNCVERPAELSGPTADIADAVNHALMDMECRNALTYDWIVTLQPAVPLRTGSIIAAMVLDCARLHCVSALTGVRTVPWQWSWNQGRAINDWSPKPYPRSQTLPALTWQELNSVQVARRDVVLNHQRWDLPLLIHFLPPWAALDIDTPADFARARLVLLPLLELLQRDDNDGALVVSDLNGLHSLTGAA